MTQASVLLVLIKFNPKVRCIGGWRNAHDSCRLPLTDGNRLPCLLIKNRHAIVTEPLKAVGNQVGLAVIGNGCLGRQNAISDDTAHITYLNAICIAIAQGHLFNRGGGVAGYQEQCH